MGKMIPRLYVFDPIDHILIADYLNPKVRGEELPYVGTVFEMERHYIYGGKQPWDIFYMIAQGRTCNAVYLFTTTPPNEYSTSTQLPIMTNIKGLIRTFMAYFLSRINNNNNNNNNSNSNSNSSDGGTWKVQGDGAYVPVEDPDNGNQVIGFKKIFIYQENDDYSDSNQDDVQWVMTEYTTLQPPKMQSLDRLVCKIEKIQKIEEVSEITDVWAEDDEEFDDEST